MASGTLIWWMCTSVRPSANADELGGHPHARVGVRPHQPFRGAYLVVNGMGRELAAVGVVDHDRLEDAAGPRIDGDAFARCADAGRSPEVGQVIGIDHAGEHEFPGRIEDATEAQLWHRCIGHGDSPFARRRSVFWSGAQVRIQLVEAVVPHPAVLIDPVQGAVECLRLEVAGPELRILAARDEPAALEHLEVFGHRGQRHVEGGSQLVDRGVAPGQAAHDGAPGRVGQRGEGRIEALCSPRGHLTT